MDVWLVRCRLFGWLAWLDYESGRAGWAEDMGEACLCPTKRSAEQAIADLRAAGFSGPLVAVRATLGELFEEV